ncbi:MAG: hypothetical protein Q9173_007305, partial [Seirophora scorigena]
MHLAVYLTFLSIGWAFHTAASPLIGDEGALLTPSTSAPRAILAREENPSPFSSSCCCSSTSSSCSPNEKRAQPFDRRTRCEVPGSSTVLLILPGAQRIVPVRYARLLDYTRLDIGRKIGYGDPTRRLLVGQVPYIYGAWGIEFRVDPAPPPPGSDPRAISLTWQMLLDTVDGVVKCVLDKGITVNVQADIVTMQPGGRSDFHGILFLERFFPPRVVSRN